MQNKYEGTVVEELAPLVGTEKGAVAYLKKKGVTPEQYALFSYTGVVERTLLVGYVITGILAGGLGWLGYISGDPLRNPQEPVWAMIAFGALGFIIGWGALKMTRGYQNKYVDLPDSGTAAYILIGVLNRYKLSYIKKKDEAYWEKVQSFSPNLNKKMYKRIVGSPKKEHDRNKLQKMTPKKKETVRKINKIGTVFAWLILGGLLFFFGESMFFIYWAWFFAGLWLFMISLAGFVEKKLGAFSVTEDVDVYGWPARALALFMMFLSLSIFILPGIALMVIELKGMF